MSFIVLWFGYFVPLHVLQLCIWPDSIRSCLRGESEKKGLLMSPGSQHLFCRVHQESLFFKFLLISSIYVA